MNWVFKISQNVAATCKWDEQEAFSVASLEFLELLQMFDPTRGRLTTFIGYALPQRLRRRRNGDHPVKIAFGYNGEAHRYHEHAERAVHAQSIYDADTVREVVQVVDESLPSPADDIDKRAIIAKLKRAVSKLGDRDREIIKRRFFQGQTLKEVGDHFGVSRERIRQIEKQAVGLLRTRMVG